MAEVEGSIRTSLVNLISTDDLRIVTITMAIGSCLGLQVFSFVVGIKA